MCAYALAYARTRRAVDQSSLSHVSARLVRGGTKTYAQERLAQDDVWAVQARRQRRRQRRIRQRCAQPDRRPKQAVQRVDRVAERCARLELIAAQPHNPAPQDTSRFPPPRSASRDPRGAHPARVAHLGGLERLHNLGRLCRLEQQVLGVRLAALHLVHHPGRAHTKHTFTAFTNAG